MQGISNRFVELFARAITSVIKGFTYYAGLLAIICADVFLGANYFAARLTHVQGPAAAWIALALSLATSAIQMALWHIIMTRDLPKRWMTGAGFLAMGVVMVADVITDLGGINLLINGTKDKTHLLGDLDPGYTAILVILAIMTACNEPIIEWLLTRASSANRVTDVASIGEKSVKRINPLRKVKSVA